MVSLFPDLFTFSLLAPFIIRVFLGLYFLLYAVRLFRNSPGVTHGIQKGHALGVIAFLGAVSVLLGVFTQGGALALTLLSAYRAKKSENKVVYALLFGMALSLLFSGAGFLAFDLPL